jgi:hypothetical protein
VFFLHGDEVKRHPESSAVDPDPRPDPDYFAPPGSGSGSFHHQEKIVRKTMISTVL